MNALSAALLSAVILSGCGAAPRSTNHAAEAAGGARSAIPAAPLSLELHVLTARGQLEARTSGGAWSSLTAGTSLPASAGVRELRAGRRGAIVSLGAGDAAGRLWLRAGTTVQLGQDERGVHLAVTSGRARLRRAASSLPLFIGASSQPTVGDVLVENGYGGAQQVTPIGARLELAAWALELDRPESGQGVGRLEAETSNDSMEPLALSKVTVDIQTAGDLAVTSVEHVFHNSADLNREGTFRFPVPDGALLTGLAMEVNGKLIEGEIVEREKARQIYEKIVDDMRDPALLEWEQGNWFKLRIFPIEAKSDKRVIIRYVQPLVHGASGWEAAFSLDQPELPIGELTVRVNGKLAAQERQVASGLDLTVPIEAAVPQVMREVRGDFAYTAVRIPAPAVSPSAPAAATSPAKAPRRLAFVFDTSRSALESKQLSLDVLRSALGELTPADRFVVLASDVAVVPHAADYVPASPEHVAAALKFLTEIEPDGASDLGAALTAVAARAPSEVVYLGDGIATWGVRDAAALAALADQVHAPIHAGLIGKGASAELWSEVSGRSGGRAQLVRSAGDAQRFALAATHAAEASRWRDARVEFASAAPEGASLFPATSTTLYAGDELVALLRTPANAAPPELVLRGVPAGGSQPVRQRISLAKPMTVHHVAQRWAAYQLEALEAADVERAQIVAVSEEFGLMSRYTSLLVLENDEAYEQHRIARRKADEQARLAAAAPQVTGGDLDSLGARDASLSPNEIQPGDPEIKIPAPRDARSVVVSFPFGETKLAVWDADASAWMVRFLIDKETPDGEYRVRVTITHADGRIETLSLPYTVDTAAPAMEMKVLRTRAGYIFRATQVESADGARRKDADKVEVVLPDGTVLPLSLVRRGVFEAAWRTAHLSAPRTLKVVVRDRALNQGTRELTLGGAL